jgi:diguanylate cyclase (GGDEF)-like protein
MRGTMQGGSRTDLQAVSAAIGQMGNYVGLMRERIRMLEAVIENFPGGISLYDSSNQMVLCNDQQKALLDYPDELFSSGFPTLEELFRFNARRGEYGPGDIEEHVRRRLALVRERRPHRYERVRPNGTVLEVRGMPIEGGGFVTTYVDVTQQRRNQELIAHMAHHDSLTDLPNRKLLADRLQMAIAYSARNGLMAVHFLDIDNFKPVNDNMGHKAGDELLVAISTRLRSSIREHDTVARLGGDEFAIVQTGIRTRSDAAVLADRIIGQISRPFDIASAQVSVGVSIGIAFAPIDGSTTDELLAKADSALYRSKAQGRCRFSFFGVDSVAA